MDLPDVTRVQAACHACRLPVWTDRAQEPPSHGVLLIPPLSVGLNRTRTTRGRNHQAKTLGFVSPCNEDFELMGSSVCMCVCVCAGGQAGSQGLTLDHVPGTHQGEPDRNVADLSSTAANGPSLLFFSPRGPDLANIFLS